MSSAGKKLQDIFDAGSAKLEELERLQRGAMKSATEAHSSAGRNTEEAVREQLEQRAKEVESGIEESIKKSVQKIQKVIDVETQETEKHLTDLVGKVESLGRRLADTIAELKEAHQTRLHHLAEDICDTYEREFESGSADLQKRNHESSQNLKVQDRFVMNSFQQKLDHSLVETRGEERQISSKLFKSFLQSTNSIDSKVSSAGQELSQGYQEHADSFNARVEAGEQELQSRIADLVEQAETHFVDIEQKINRHFDNVTSQRDKESDRRSDSAKKDLKELHEASTQKLSEMVRECAGNLTEVANQGQERLGASCDEATEKADSTLESFNGDCKRRLDSSLQLKETLEKRKEEFFANTKKDLIELQSAFERRLAETQSQAMKRLTAAMQNAEQAIVSAEKASAGQMQTIGNAAKNHVQSSADDFLSRLKEKRQAAIDEVQTAAGISVAQAEPSKKGKKSKSPATAPNHPTEEVGQPKSSSEDAEGSTRATQEMEREQ